MLISVVIVSYNSWKYLRLCLNSLENAKGKGEREIIVVDNASGDETVGQVRQSFPGVILLENEENRGYSAACNQGIKRAAGEYILILNPDTIIPPDTFTLCLKEMSDNLQTGAIGARLVDKRGKYLPESKRGIPWPATAFWRFSGLYRLFPRSAVINHYYMGQLPDDQTTETEAVTGAFMFMPATVVRKAGGFDESYFLFGEDIDLCMRISEAGYRIIYLPSVVVTHFKGHSGAMRSLRGINEFYRSMHIFAAKNFKERHGDSSMLLIHSSIEMIRLLSLLKRMPLILAEAFRGRECFVFLRKKGKKEKNMKSAAGSN